jgi:membrane associated rhomboid family serine protease
MLRTPPVTKNLIIITTLMYFAMMVARQSGVDLNELLGLHFVLAQDFHVYQLFTYMFMHANFTHIFFNLFMFWMFGRTMESVWGAKRFLWFYFACGIGAGLIQECVQMCTYYIEGLSAFDMVSVGALRIPMQEYLNQWTTVGASGAIYGILLGFGMTFPNERILLLIPPIPIKAKYMVIASIVLELILGLEPNGSNVAHFAHLGGMLFGWLIIHYWRRQERKMNSNFASWQEYKPERMSFFSRMREKMKTHKENKETTYAGDRQDDYDYNEKLQADQKEVDRILDKIKSSGYESLTETEKQKLFDAGRK